MENKTKMTQPTFYIGEDKEIVNGVGYTKQNDGTYKVYTYFDRGPEYEKEHYSLEEAKKRVEIITAGILAKEKILANRDPIGLYKEALINLIQRNYSHEITLKCQQSIALIDSGCKSYEELGSAREEIFIAINKKFFWFKSNREKIILSLMEF